MGRIPIRRIPVLPTLLTLGNLFCGFASLGLVVKAASSGATSEDVFIHSMEWAGWLILLAMVFDALDGKVARLARMTSEFGKHLDSLSDVVSFGVAPALIVKVLATNLSIFPRVAWVTSTMFVLCAAMRLARFSAETGQSDESHYYFSGLPSPAAAGLIASLVVMHFNLKAERGLSRIATKIEPIVQPFMVMLVHLMPLLAVILALLMISNIRYSHMVNRMLSQKRPFDYLMRIIFVVLFAFLTKPFSLPLIFAAYMGSGLVGWVRARIGHRASAAAAGEDAAEPTNGDDGG